MALTPFESMQVAIDCVRFVTGSTRPLNPSEELVRYGVNSSVQSTLVRHNICSNGSIGVQRFNHSLNPIFLATLSGGWTFVQLAGVIRGNARPNGAKSAMAGPAMTNAKSLAIAHAKIAEAMELLGNLSSPKQKPKVSASASAFKGMTDKKLAAHFSPKKPARKRAK